MCCHIVKGSGPGGWRSAQRLEHRVIAGAGGDSVKLVEVALVNKNLEVSGDSAKLLEAAANLGSSFAGPTYCAVPMDSGQQAMSRASRS